MDNNQKENDHNDNNITKSETYICDRYYNKKEGLLNLGSNCYMNGFLQILIHVPGLIEKIKSYKDIISKENLLYSLINIADFPSKENLYEFAMKFIQKNSSFKYYKQGDSQEFGIELLKALDKELSELNCYISKWNLEDEFDFKNVNEEVVKIKLDKLKGLMQNEDCNLKLQTIINSFFYYYETILFFNNNKVINFSYYGDAENQLRFDINNINNSYKNNLSIFDMLKKKYLSGKNKLIKLPKIYNITLLRSIIKGPIIDIKVVIDREINLREFLDKDFGDYSLSTEYTLYALNIRIGSSKKYGHCYSYILINNQWYKFDDFNTEKVEQKIINEDLSYIYGIYYINKEYLKSLYLINNDNR